MSFFYFASLFYLQNSVIIDAISMRNSRWHAFVESPGIATCSGRIYEHVLSVCFSFAGQIKGSDGRARLESHDSWVYSQGHLQEFRFQELPSARERPDIRISDQTFGTTLSFILSNIRHCPTVVPNYYKYHRFRFNLTH